MSPPYYVFDNLSVLSIYSEVLVLLNSYLFNSSFDYLSAMLIDMSLSYHFYITGKTISRIPAEMHSNHQSASDQSIQQMCRNYLFPSFYYFLWSALFLFTLPSAYCVDASLVHKCLASRIVLLAPLGFITP